MCAYRTLWEAGVGDKDRDFVGALEKGLSVIEAFDRSHIKLTLSEVARRADLSRAAARRYLLTLARLGYAESDGKWFWLAPRVLRLGYAFLSTTSLPRLAQPILDRIGERTQEVVTVAVLDGRSVVFLAHSASRRIISATTGVGTRIPVYCSAAGRALLAHQPDAEVERFLKAERFDQLTPKTKTEPRELRREIVKVRADGYAVSDEELEIGLRSIAVAVPDSRGQASLSLAVSLHAGRMSVARMIEQCLPELEDGRRELAAMI